MIQTLASTNTREENAAEMAREPRQWKRIDWTTEDSAAASAEGWDVFDCSEHGEEIQMIDDAEATSGFSGDNDAVDHCKRRAAEGSALHIKALEIDKWRMP